MTAVSFVVPGKPCGVNATHTGGARPFVKSREARAFAAKVALMGTLARRRAKWETTSGPVEVAIRVMFANERPDTDGPVKAILDALQTATNRRIGAGFIANDRQVRRYTVERFIDRKQPRVEVTVSLAGEPKNAMREWDCAPCAHLSSGECLLGLDVPDGGCPEFTPLAGHVGGGPDQAVEDAEAAEVERVRRIKGIEPS